MKYFDWDEEKNIWLIANRGICFEMCQLAVEEGKVLDIVQNKKPYEHQKKFVIQIQDYVYIVPFVEDEHKIFLKTMYPSRKNTKVYLKNNNKF